MCLNQFSAFMLFMFMQKIKRFNASNGYEKPHFGPFCPHPFWSKNLKTRFFPKVILFNYNLFCCNFMQKIRKVPCIEFWIIPEKPHIGPIVGHFWPQNFKNKFILKNFFLSILSSYDVMSCKKSQNSSKHWLLIWNINWNKIWLSGPFQKPFGPKTWKQYFHKKVV